MKISHLLRWPLMLLIIAAFAMYGAAAEAKKGGKGKGADKSAEKADKGKPDKDKPDKGKPDKDKPDKDKPDKDKPDKDKPDKGKPDKGKPDDKGGLQLGKDKEPGQGLALGKDKEPGEGLALGKDKDAAGVAAPTAGAAPDGSGSPGTLTGKKKGLGMRYRLLNEQKKHLRRLAKIARLEELAGQSGNTKLADKAKTLRDKEQRRHDKVLARLSLGKHGKGKGGGK
jgi:hypothetical protein